MENTNTPSAEHRTRWPRRPWRVAGLAAAILVALLVVAGVALRYVAATDFGRGVITSLIDGRRAGPLGTLRITGLAGDPFKSMTARDLAFIDENGAWMRASNIELDWSPLDLLSRQLDIERLHINTVDVFRRPQVAPRESSGGGIPDFGLRIGNATIDEIRIEDGVYGARASYRFETSANIARNRAGDLSLDITPLNGMGDHIDAVAAWTETGLTDARVSAEGLAGGTLAALIQSPEGEPVNLTVQADGSATNLTANATLRFGDQMMAEFRATRTDQTGQGEGYLRLADWPLLNGLERRLGERVDFQGELDFARPSRAPMQFELQSPAGRVTGVGVANLDRMNTRGPVAMNLYDIDLARQASTITSGQLSGRGEARIGGLRDWSFSGPVEVANLSVASVSAASIAGAVEVDFDDDLIVWQSEDAQAEAFTLTSLDSFPPTQVTAQTQGSYSLPERTLTITNTNLTTTVGSSTVRGSYRLTTGAMDFSGAATAAQLSAFANYSGSASGDWSVERTSRTAPYRITLDGSGQNLSTPNATLTQLLGQNPTIAAAATWLDGAFTLEDANVLSETISLNLNGETTASGALTGTISGEVLSPLDLPGARVEAVRIDGVLSGTPSNPRAQIDIADGQVMASGVSLTDLAGRTTITNDEALVITADITGAADGQPLEAEFALSRSGDSFSLSDVNIAAGELVLSAPSLSLADGRASGEFSLNGSLAGLAGFARGDVTANGNLDFEDDQPLVTISGEARNLRRPYVDLRRATFDAALQGDMIEVNADLESAEASGPRLRLDVQGRREAETWTGAALIDGAGGAQPIAMTEPANWTYGPDGYTFNGRTNIFAGQIVADIESTTNAQSLQIDLADIDLRSLTRLIQLSPVVGTATGSISINATPGAPRTGRFDLQLNDANALGAEVEAIDVRLQGNLQNERLTVTATGSGGNFSIDGRAQLRTTGEGLAVLPDRDANVSARLDLDGRAEQFWAIARQRSQSLSGDLNLNFTAAGRLGAPALDGGFSLTDGVYDHGETGFHLENIRLEGEFNQRSVRLTSVRGVDGNGGQLSGQGRLDWSGDLAGGVDFEATGLHALNRDDRSAVVSGTGAVTVEPQAILITGDMNVSNARFSVEQPASEKIPTLPSVRRVNFAGREDTQREEEVGRPIRLDLQVEAPRRVYVYGRGLDMEWSTDFEVTGSVANPIVDGRATLIRGDLTLAGRRFPFNQGTITLDGPIRSARIDITATGNAEGAEARVRLTGTPVDPQFRLESTPPLPQDEILSRLIFGRSAAELSALETAQLAAALTQLAGGQAAFDPAGLIREATGLDRISIGTEGDTASIAAGKYISEDVYLQLGAGGEGGAAAEVEWEPIDSLSVISSAQGNGDTKMTVRWKKDY